MTDEALPVEHGDAKAESNGGRGVHPVPRFPPVTTDAERLAKVLNISDRFGIIAQLAGALPGMYGLDQDLIHRLLVWVKPEDVPTGMFLKRVGNKFVGAVPSSAPPDIDAGTTAETDTAKRLAPDGAGGVAWVSESGSVLFSAGVFPAGGPHALVADVINRYDASAGDVSLQFPAAPADNTVIRIKEVVSEYATDKVTMLGNGSSVENPHQPFATTNTGFAEPGLYAEWRFSAAQATWKLVSFIKLPGTRRFIVNTQGVAITRGQAVRQTASDAVVTLAKADGASTAQFDAFVAQGSIADGVDGVAQYDNLAVIPAALQEGGAWVPGEIIYVSADTAGSYTRVAPSAAGQFVVPVGRVNAFLFGGIALVWIERGEISEIT